MATQITYRRNALMAQATLTDTEDDGRAFVFCSLPGGRPWMTFDPQSQQVISIANGPTCDTEAEFRAFVSERFGQS